MILAIRTDKPEAELYLYESGKLVATKKWIAHRQLAAGLLVEIRDMLNSEGLSYESVSRIIVYTGPGSFTGLRIGISVANSLADSLGVPVVGLRGDDWINKGRITEIDKGTWAEPYYERDAYTTAPKK